MGNKKVCVITGGTLGIGKSTVEKFLKHKYYVYNFDKLPAEDSDNLKNIVCDVSDLHQLKVAINAITESYVDVLIGNAGIHFSSNILNSTEDDFQKLVAINLKSNFFLIQYILPKMLAHKKGSIVLVGSDQSVIAKPNSALYGMTKMALVGLTKTTALDFAKEGIRCNLVAPGTIRTPLYETAVKKYSDRSGIPLANIDQEESLLQPIGRLGTAEEVANLIYFLSSEEASFITGSVYSIDGGYTCR